jgi:hypothetical protein
LCPGLSADRSGVCVCYRSDLIYGKIEQFGIRKKNWLTGQNMICGKNSEAHLLKNVNNVFDM